MCKWHPIYHWKALVDDYNFVLDITSIEGLHTKLCASKITSIPLENLKTKWHLELALWPSTKNNIKGKVVASPKSRPWWVVWVYVCLWLIRAPKCSSYTLTNLLFGLCRSVWIIDLLVNLPSPHPGVLARPSTPKVLQAKEQAPTPFPSVVFTFGLTIESTKKLGGCVTNCHLLRLPIFIQKVNDHNKNVISTFWHPHIKTCSS